MPELWSHCEGDVVTPEDVLDREELADYYRARRERANKRASHRAIQEARRAKPVRDPWAEEEQG